MPRGQRAGRLRYRRSIVVVLGGAALVGLWFIFPQNRVLGTVGTAVVVAGAAGVFVALLVLAGLARDYYAKQVGRGMGEALEKMRYDASATPVTYPCGCVYEGYGLWQPCYHHNIVNGQRLPK